MHRKLKKAFSSNDIFFRDEERERERERDKEKETCQDEAEEERKGKSHEKLTSGNNLSHWEKEEKKESNGILSNLMVFYPKQLTRFQSFRPFAFNFHQKNFYSRENRGTPRAKLSPQQRKGMKT